MEAQGNINNSAPAAMLLPKNKHYQPKQETASLHALSIEVIKVQMLPYLNNDDLCNLFDSCCYMRPLKQTEFIFKFNRKASLSYATNAAFRAKVHRSAAIDQQRSTKRMIKINLSRFQNINDVSMLGEVMELNLNGCDGVINVTALDEAGCYNIANLDTFIRRLIAVLNTNNNSTSNYAATGKQCAVFTLGNLAFDNQSNQDLIAAEGGITALIAVLNDASDESGADKKIGAVSALWQLAEFNERNQQLIGAEGGILALVAVLRADDFNSSCSKMAKMEAAKALRILALNNESNSRCLFPALVAILNGVPDHSSAEMKKWTAHTLSRCAHFHYDAYDRTEQGCGVMIPEVEGYEEQQDLIAAEGGVTALIALLNENTSDDFTADAKMWAAHALKNLAYDNENNQQLIAMEGGIIALISVINDQSNNRSAEAAKMEATGALKYLATGNSNNQQLILAEGGITALIAMLKDDSTREEVKKKVADFLLQLADDDESIAMCLVPFLIALLNEVPYHSSAEAKIRAAQILAGYAYDWELYSYEEMICNQDLIAAEGGITALVAILTDTSDKTSAEVKKEAVKALRCLAAHNPANRQLVATAGGITALLTLLNDASDRRSEVAKQEAAEALSYIVDDEESNQQLIVAEGGISVLIFVLKDDIPDQRRQKSAKMEAAKLLEKLAVGNPITQQLIAAEEGAIAALVALAKDVSCFEHELARKLLKVLAASSAAVEAQIRSAGGARYMVRKKKPQQL